MNDAADDARSAAFSTALFITIPTNRYAGRLAETNSSLPLLQRVEVCNFLWSHNTKYIAREDLRLLEIQSLSLVCVIYVKTWKSWHLESELVVRKYMDFHYVAYRTWIRWPDRAWDAEFLLAKIEAKILQLFWGLAEERVCSVGT